MTFKLHMHTLIILSVIISGCHFQSKDPLPTELLGTWETTEGKYDGASFHIAKDTIIFSNEKYDHRDVNRISRIKVSSQEEKTLYEIEYEDDEGIDYQFSFYHIKSEGENLIYLTNREEIPWAKNTQPEKY